MSRYLDVIKKSRNNVYTLCIDRQQFSDSLAVVGCNQTALKTIEPATKTYDKLTKKSHSFFCNYNELRISAVRQIFKALIGKRTNAMEQMIIMINALGRTETKLQTKIDVIR